MNIEHEGISLEIVTGDIAHQTDIAAVVNAANAQLVSGGGVAGALHSAAGPKLATAGRPYAPLEPGNAVLTDAFELPNRYVIHCLGPVYGEDEPADQLLADCYRNALKLAEKHKISSIAFPALSTGAFGYPIEEAADVSMRAVREMLSSIDHVRLIRFVLFSESDRIIYEGALQRRFPGAPR